MPALTSNLAIFSEQRRAVGASIVSQLVHLTPGPRFRSYIEFAVHQIGISSTQLDSESELETAKSVARSRATALYVLCSTVSMLICLLLAACIRRQRRRMHDSEAREAAREASRLARAELRAVSLKPKIMSFRICIDGLEDGICPICLDPLAAAGQVCAGECGHPVHEACLFQWLVKDESMSCPVCRAPFQILTSPILDSENCTGPPPEEEANQNANQDGAVESSSLSRGEEARLTNDGATTNDYPLNEGTGQAVEQTHPRTEGDTTGHADNGRHCCTRTHNRGEPDVRDTG